MKPQALTFAELGDLFNDATSRLEGGINAPNRTTILSDLAHVQTGLEKLIQSNPDQFQGVAGIHAQNIVDQLNLEIGAVRSVGSDPFAAKYINDVHRDLIDIVQGDPQLHTLATHGGHNGFAPVPDLLVHPAQFQGNAEQTQFMQNFVAASQSFADRAVALVDQHARPDAVQPLVTEIQVFEKSADAFTVAQGGLYSARFNNEFADNGVNGTASRALIDGLNSANADKVHAAAEVLVANAADVAGNMLGIGQPPVVTGTGIPDHVDTFAQAGAIFNDATTKLIGGVYDGNRQSIHADLTATQQGITDLLAQHPDQFQGQAGVDAHRIVALLSHELQIVDNVNAGPHAPSAINALQREVINIVHNDAALTTAATQDGGNGFMPLPGVLHGHGGNSHSAGNDGAPAGADHGHGAHAPTPIAQAAAVPPHDIAHQPDPLAHIFTSQTDHHFG